ncbi:MAG: hypothetical protein SNG10_01330 [Rikenellaceae bacterium]
MKRTIILATLLTFVAVCFTPNLYSAEKRSKRQTEGVINVSSLEELLPYLKKDNVTLTMTPGTYRVTPADIKANKFPDHSEVREGEKKNVLLLVTANNSSYDFTGVTVEVESAVFNSFENRGELHDLHLLGSNNTIKNIKFVDVGKPTDVPQFGCTNIAIDGANNLVEGVEVHSQGSYPYGYGSLFGIGGKNVIRHRKHCACLLRGDNNHLKNCKFYHNAFGHFIFMQGAQNPTIEGCYTEGKMNTTDNVLAEKGTGSAADKVGFMTFYGYVTPPGYTFPIGEDGIRTYASGNTMIDGVRYSSRETGGKIVVKDCVVKHARRGISLAHGGGDKYVENCTLIGCKSGYSVNDGGQIVNCRADAAFGPAIWIFSNNTRNVTADITIIPYEGEPYTGNKSGQAAVIAGRNNNITLRKGKGFKNEGDLAIYVGGDCKALGHLNGDNNNPAHNNTIINKTGLPVIVDDNTSGNIITTNGEYTDEGTNNTITAK